MVAHRHAAFAEESAEVEVLYASLERMKAVTKKIQSSMARLNETGRTVEDAIGPIYSTTQRLQAQNSNIEKILGAIQKVKQPLDMRTKEEQVIRSRPDRVGLAEYIASIDRTNTALRELKSSNLRSNQTAITELSSLMAIGISSLETIFRDTIRQDSQPIEPLKQITSGQDFPRIPSSKSAQLRTINANITSYAAHSNPDGGLTPSAKVYSIERGQYIALSLQNLATACISTARKVSPDSTYKPGSCAIATYANGIQGMFIAEYENICPIYSREEWGPVLTATCQDAMRTFSATLRDLDSHVKSHIISDCYLAYEILDAVSSMSFQIEDRTGLLKQTLSDALKPVRETAKSSLSILLNDVKSKASQFAQLSPDGAPVPITADVIVRLQAMTAFLAPISSILRSLGAGGWKLPAISSTSSVPTLKSFDVGADGKQLFAQYVSDTIEELLLALESRAKVLLKGKSLQGIFLANNIAIIERMVNGSELKPILGASGLKLDMWKRKAVKLYLEAWGEPTAFLFDKQYTNKGPRPPSTGAASESAAILKSLSSKDKDAVKEKFRGFNASFDELLVRFKMYKIDPDVRRDLVKEVSSMVYPLYSRFYERYHEVDKGKGKYVKYDNNQLAAALETLR